MKMLKNFYCRFLVILSFIVAIIEIILEVFTLTIYSRIMKKIGIDDMVGYKILKYSEKFY